MLHCNRSWAGVTCAGDEAGAWRVMQEAHVPEQRASCDEMSTMPCKTVLWTLWHACINFAQTCLVEAHAKGPIHSHQVCLR